MMRVSVLITAVGVAVTESWIVPLLVVMVAGLNVTVVPSERPVALSTNGAVDVVVREKVRVAGTVTPCLAIIRFGAMDSVTGMMVGGVSFPFSVAPGLHVAVNTMLQSSNACRMRRARRLVAGIVRQ
jgi:hypothetical protein